MPARGERILSEALLRSFGEARDKEQAELLDTLGEGLWYCCNRDAGKFETQCCYIEKHLSSLGRKLVMELAEFCKLTEDGVQ